MLFVLSAFGKYKQRILFQCYFKVGYIIFCFIFIFFLLYSYPCYEKRLMCLISKKRFKPAIDELREIILNLDKARIELLESDKFRDILELILAIGNYMNTGIRGNASGFQLGSINKLVDTKSTDGTTTLLNFIVSIMDNQFRELLNLSDDLKHVELASKINFLEIENEMQLIRTGLDFIEKELNEISNNDLNDFYTIAVIDFIEIEIDFSNAQINFNKLIKYFGEDDCQPCEFFGVINTFLTSFTKAREYNDKMKLKQTGNLKRVQQVKLYIPRFLEKLCIIIF